VKKNSQLLLPSKCLICANAPMVSGGNDSQPLRFPLQCTNIVPRLDRKYFESMARPAGLELPTRCFKRRTLYPRLSCGPVKTHVDTLRTQSHTPAVRPNLCRTLCHNPVRLADAILCYS